IATTKRQVLVGTGTQVIALSQLAPAGKRPMRAADWARGAALPADAAFVRGDQDEDQQQGQQQDGAQA
ncbi:MAG: hypothetical protein ACTH8W_10405, partial [Brachybacterium tyrofermentans]